MNMMHVKSIDARESHQAVWARLEPLLAKGNLPPAFLFTGRRHLEINLFADRLMARLLCEDNDASPCGRCKSCHLLIHGIHPDIQYLGQESLKIDHIRELQRDIYQTPQRGAYRFIVIFADGLHKSVANALLKMLEEPPSHTLFIVMTEDANALPLTIVSRCQQYVFSQSDTQADFLALGQSYPEGSVRSTLAQEQTQFIAGLCDVILMKISPCTFVSQWSRYELEDLLWFLYLITADTIQLCLMPKLNHPLVSLAKLMNPVRLFNQLSVLNGLIKKNNRGIAINTTLALEALLFGYIEESLL